MFIEVDKIVTKYKKDNQNEIAKNPISNKPIIDGMKVVRETIRLDEIKSAREYHDPKVYMSNGIKGSVTVVYMKGTQSRGERLPEIHINEDIKDWNKRIEAVSLPVEK